MSRKILRIRIILIDKTGKVCYDSTIKMGAMAQTN